MKLIRTIINEVRYINPNTQKEEPLLDSQTIRVYHGFYNFKDVETVLKLGLTGKERAPRIHSYEARNNPYGLFVTIDFNIAKDFGSNSGVIIEFSTKLSDLEAPVWVGGRSYFVQGEYALTFKNMEERQQQVLINRQRAGESPYDYISKSDRPELAETIFDNYEKQALFIGDLNPNMIKYVWYNESLHKKNLKTGKWVKFKRKEFIKKLNIDVKHHWYYPNDDFTFDEFKNKLKSIGDERYFDDYLESIAISLKNDDYRELHNYGFYPKQINQLKNLYSKGEFDKYL